VIDASASAWRMFHVMLVVAEFDHDLIAERA